MNGVRLTRTMEWGGMVEGNKHKGKARMEYKYGTVRELEKKGR